MSGENHDNVDDLTWTSELSSPSSSQNSQKAQETPSINTRLKTRSKTLTKEKKQVPKENDILSMETLAVWSDVEKINLLDHLYTYGVESKLTYSCLKTKNEDQIRNFLRTRQRLARIKKQARIDKVARKKLTKEEQDASSSVTTPLEEWTQHFFQKFDEDKSTSTVTPALMMHLLPATFLILSLFEAHPEPSESNGINYRDVYEFLYTVSRGNPAKMLSKATANFLFTAFYDASKFYRMAALGDENVNESYYLSAISNVNRDQADESVVEKPVKFKTYPGKRKHAATKKETKKEIPEFMSKLLKTQAINPFKIPIDYLEFPFDNLNMKKTTCKQKLATRQPAPNLERKDTEPF